ncbi:MAG TPA: HD domain-containing protein [Myxococcota bacterium]|nr:HD domain-containing protein [Myxococcota bacterium]HQP94893.1 HD domain-containing protein [Myxococcota bacterium]
MIGRRLTDILAPFGYHLTFAEDMTTAIHILSTNLPDLVIISSNLENSGSYNLLRCIRTDRATQQLPVLMFLEAPDSELEVRAFQYGVDEVVSSLSQDIAVRARVRVLLRISAYRKRIENEKRRLELRVQERTKELMEITFSTVAALEKAAEYSDQQTGHHMSRVAEYSCILARHLDVGAELIEKIRIYAPLHDLGKVGISHDILKKKGILTPEEFDEMKKHTIMGYDMLKAARADPVACNIALCHHERIDGTGYPNHLKGSEIPIEARIVSVADVYDALITKRHYKQAMTPENALACLNGEMAGHFDGAVLRAFAEKFDEIREISERMEAVG